MTKLPLPSGPSEIARRYSASEPAAKPKAPPHRQSKAQKVKEWREANPEAYARQKREYAERRAAKKAKPNE